MRFRRCCTCPGSLEPVSGQLNGISVFMSWLTSSMKMELFGALPHTLQLPLNFYKIYGKSDRGFGPLAKHCHHWKANAIIQDLC